MNITRIEYEAIRERCDRARGVVPEPVAAVGPACARESELHRQIVAWCKARGWQCWHGDMTKRTHRPPGEPDFHIVGDKGRYWQVECKQPGEDLTPDQAEVRASTLGLGHRHGVVQTMAEFEAFMRREL